MNDESLPNEGVSKKDLPLFIKWMDYVKWLLTILDSFPKKAKFNFSDRLVHLALTIIEDLVEARYSRNKSFLLKKINLNLEKIRILMRISYELRYLSKASYAHSSLLLNEVGKMVGGWMKQQSGGEYAPRE